LAEAGRIDVKKPTSAHGRLTAVSMMKDEAPYLLEWVAHHLAVGFTDIVVYTNDCSDGTDDMLIRLEQLGLAHHRRNVIPKGRKPQPSAIKHAQSEPIVQESDWVLVFDADEFLCINHGDGTLDGLISAAGPANGIVITWRIFGSGNVQDWSRDPVTEQYLFAAPPLWNKGWGVKTLFRFDAEYWKLGIHRPKMKNKHLKTDFPDSVRWLNGSGKPMEDYFKFRGWRSIRRTIGYDWAQMNHYAVKSIDAYAVRKFRGNVNNKADKYNADYWALQDRNELRDTSILRYSEQRAAIVDGLLKDAVLKRLHFAALKRVEARLAEFRKTDEHAKLKADLIVASQTPITKLEAKPPKPRDPAKIAALMSRVEKKDAARPKEEKRHASAAGFDTITGKNDWFAPMPIDRSSEVAIEKVANHGVLLPADPRIFTPAVLQDVVDGKFDRRAARSFGRFLSAGDRVLFIGAGVGFLPILACRQHPDIAVLAQEERADLAQIGREIASQNGDFDASHLTIIDGPLFPAANKKRQAGGLQVRDFKPCVVVLNDDRVLAADLGAVLGNQVKRLILAETLLGSREKTGAAFSDPVADAGFTAIPGTEKSGFLIYDRG